MEEELKPFVRRGTGNKPIKVGADEVLNAIAEGQDVRVVHVVIDGELDIGTIANRLNLDKNGKMIIQSELNFAYVTFKGNVNFNNIISIGKTKFSHATFTENADFNDATFGKETSFNRTTFKGNPEGIFGVSANFKRAIFTGRANFGYTTFIGDADFSDAIFGGRAYFGYTTFIGDTHFGSADFSVSANFFGTHMKYPAGFEDVRFRENTVFAGLWNDVIRPMCWCFLWLLGCGVCMLWEKIQEKERIPTDFSRFSKVICDICNIWKKVRAKRWPVTVFSNFNTTIVMNGSSNPYLKRYIDDEQWIKSWRERGRLHKILFILWEATSHCGRSFLLWLGWSIFFAGVFAVIYRWGFGYDSIVFNVDKLNGIQPDFWGYLYYSVVTFTTLGFGDIVPMTNPARLVVGAEVVLGYIMLGGLISIFANKFARRS